ncbi:MAG TPA: di-heme oxidoredictase family protein [Isosphaeraceae bacterium]|nr:di-heme oxidoredictase family protein [Isosphaeraceae bacterium]
MSARESAIVAARTARVVLGLGACAMLAMAGLARAADAPSKKQLDQGRELFVREWMVNDARSHGGDGLGPVYNDTSCVACHNAGTSGGGGPNSKNVDIVSAFPNQNGAQVLMAPAPGGFLVRAFESLLGIERPAPPAMPKPPKPDTTELVKAHAGFRTARSVVLHRFGNDASYESWKMNLVGLGQFGMNPPAIGSLPDAQRGQMEMQQVRFRMQMGANLNQTQGQVGTFTLTLSQRNPTALFGAGLIDSIPDDVLLAAAKQSHRDFPEVVGRVSRLKSGKIGRFGWKGQTPSLEDFVLTACAVELGLEVPGHPQAGLPQAPEAKAKGLDLNGEECASLTAFVKSLPRPIARMAANETEAKEREAGQKLFASVGCATCHSPKLGEVDGIYSDLLLHDMGPELADTGQYGVFVPDSSDPDFVDPEQPPAEGPIATAPAILPAPPDSTTTPADLPVAVPAPQPVPTVSDVVRTTQVFRSFAFTRQILPAPMPPFAVPPTMVGQQQPTKPATGPATRQEWRTPPLWGFRDSGPYLHDGRAQTLDQAVAMHGGQSERSAQKFFALSPNERLQLQTFLKSLVAPTESEHLASASK